ncbi:MAG TPA: prolyl oligopeptidase family serine peptidase [Gemmatimonadaceae bacterium]|nr:prolyl oligopeptidase family serine peptidase [Gemmatimonadaceae bacterium]
MPSRTVALARAVALFAVATPAVAQTTDQTTRERGARGGSTVVSLADSLTIRDLLDMNSVSVQDLSPDGRWLVVTKSTRRDGLGTNYYRDNDPTYLRAAMSQLVLIDTKSGEQRPIVPTRKGFRGAQWSPDGAKLAVFTIENDALQLNVWDRAANKMTPLKLPVPQYAGHYIAENSELRWTADSKQLAFALRTDAWKKRVTDRFNLLTKGPIVVLDGSDPFLEWDELGRNSAIRSVVSWDIASGAVKTLVPDGRVNSWTLALDGTAVTVNEDLTQRTNYGGGGGGGRAGKLVTHIAGAAPKTLYATTTGAQISWAEDGRRYAITRDGRVYIASIDDTTGRQILGATGPIRGGAGGGRAGGGRGGRGGVGADSTPPDTSAAGRAAANERFTVSRWSSKGDEILATNRQGIWVVNVASGAKEMLIELPDTTSQEPRPTVSLWSNDGRYIYLSKSSRTKWDREVLRYDRQTKQTASLARGAKYFNGLRLSDDGSTTVLTIADGNRQGDIFVGDAAMGNLRRLVQVNPQLATKPIANTELISYLDADGRNQYGVLFYPANYQRGTRYPTVFIIYESFFDDTWDGVANLLASNGYAVVKPSVSFEIGFPGEAWTKGVTAAANHVINMGVADSARLGVHGTSYGGYATNLLVTKTNRFKAAINISGKVDIISFYTDSPRLGARNINAAEASQDRIGATLWEQPQKYVEHSAIMFADRIKTPLLLLTGGQDHNVPELNEREMYYALRRLGKTVTWVSYTNGGHGTPGTTEADFTDWHQRMLDWYGKYLKSDKKAAMN